MINGLDTIKKFTVKVGKTIVSFSGKGIRVKPRYRLLIVDESRYTTLASFRGTRLRFLGWGITLCLIITIGGAALLGMTPLKSLLPGYLHKSERNDVATMSMRIDSMRMVADLNNMYLNNMIAIMNDEVNTDSLTELYNDSIQVEKYPVDSLMATSDAELEFVRRHQQRERFNVSVLSPIAADGMIFQSPVSTPITVTSDPSGAKTILMPPSQTVTSIYRGTVIDRYLTPGQGYTVAIQHPNEFISYYRGLENTLVNRGEKVSSGTALGVTSPGSGLQRRPITFEMWYNGSILDPAAYIPVFNPAPPATSATSANYQQDNE